MCVFYSSGTERSMIPPVLNTQKQSKKPIRSGFVVDVLRGVGRWGRGAVQGVQVREGSSLVKT